MNTLVTALATALAFSAPPILPYTELNDKKIENALQHMADADECTLTDMQVLMQLDHIRWKYEEMRKSFYIAASESADGSTVNAKDLGKMFDTIDSALENFKESAMQSKKAKMEREAKSDSAPKQERGI